jgi:hypothetical protein
MAKAISSAASGFLTQGERSDVGRAGKSATSLRDAGGALLGADAGRGASNLLALQGLAGNAAVAQLLQRSTIGRSSEQPASKRPPVQRSRARRLGWRVDGHRAVSAPIGVSLRLPGDRGLAGEDPLHLLGSAAASCKALTAQVWSPRRGCPQSSLRPSGRGADRLAAEPSRARLHAARCR